MNLTEQIPEMFMPISDGIIFSGITYVLPEVQY